MRKWVSNVEEGLNSVDASLKEQIMKPAGQACALDLEELCQQYLGKKIVGVQDLVAGWNRLRESRGLKGKWEIRGHTIEGIFGECGCPLIHSGLIKLHPTRCHCTKAMLETIFSKFVSTTVGVEIRKSIARGDQVCHFMIRM